MNKIIYIRLLDEGTNVFRAVNAINICESIYKISHMNEYDKDDEIWEFLPGDAVKTIEKELDGDLCIVAIEKYVH